MRRVLPGKPDPLGATWDGSGVNFAIYSQRAERVELCLFDQLRAPESERIELAGPSASVWHCYLPSIHPGQLYGYRVHGPYDTKLGLRFDPSKVLIDPYARATAGKMDWTDPDAVRGMPKCVVTSPLFDWEHDRPPNIPWADSIIYELHVKGFTQRHPGVPEELRGTYAGLASSASIHHLKTLGITAVELLPVHESLDDQILFDRGLSNYWGYNTLNYFSPDSRFSSSGDRGEQVAEFKQMVKTLHREGIEVILDVVYNHTCEGNHLGPTLGFRGIDNTTYYRLVKGNEEYYMDYTGTGNTLNSRHPQTLKLIMDSLRYWVLDLHVDGFRFDLAATLARGVDNVDRYSAFLSAVHQDPVLSRVKLIAEPWDIGSGGYQIGNFPAPWAEWNDRFRDTVRRYWKGDHGQVSDLSRRLAGSSDLYEREGRGPIASINFVTAHDGFTLQDLVSYAHKHNQANGENNHDGTSENHSSSLTGELRERQKRNLLATLFFSQGVPMLLAGDEMGRTQHGNNNAYCQDNELTWHDWELGKQERELLEYTRKLIALRREYPAFLRAEFAHDWLWLRPDGHPMTSVEWEAGWVQCLGLMREGLLLLVNSHQAAIRFRVPAGSRWEVLVDTRKPELKAGSRFVRLGRATELGGLSLMLLREVK